MKNIVFIVFVFASVNCFAQRNPFKNMSERNGQIGIGTKSPDALLTVKGNIHAQEVLIDLNGAVAPDYVFERYFMGSSELNPQYTMLSIPETAAYIEKYHHLPGVPSAKAMEKDGLSIKELNLLLLEKIEELTLYTIEQQKEIDGLKEKVSLLRE